MKLRLPTGLALMALMSLGFSAAEGSAAMKAGVATVVITPEEYTWMSGYASRDKPAEGKVQELYAKALAIEDARGGRVVIVTTDLIGLTAGLCGRVAERAGEKTGLPREALMFTSSHTHSGPVIRDNLETMYQLPEAEWEKITRYTRQLEDKLVDVVCAAVENLAPAELTRGNGEAGFAVNRRIYVPYSSPQFGENFIGPVDHDVPTLVAETQAGEPLAVLFGYACHNTTLSFFQYCGDYAGYAQEYLGEMVPGATALYFAGCAGDANPTPRRVLDHAKAHGRELAEAVRETMLKPMTPVDGTIRTAYRIIDLPLVEAPTMEEIEKQLQDENKYIRLRARDLKRQLEERGAIPETYPYPIQVWAIGEDYLFIGLAGEVVVDYSLTLKHKYGKDRTWVASYANDVPAYIPSVRILQEGGYEGDTSFIYYGLHGPWKQEIEGMILAAVDGLVETVRGEQ